MIINGWSGQINPPELQLEHHAGTSTATNFLDLCFLSGKAQSSNQLVSSKSNWKHEARIYQDIVNLFHPHQLYCYTHLVT